MALEMDGEVGPRGVLQAESGMTVREAPEKAGGVQKKMSLPGKILSPKIEKSSRISIVPLPLNTATAEELDTLPGIGPKTARAIVEFREQNGKFSTLDDLLQVPGIGPRKLAALLPHIKIQ